MCLKHTPTRPPEMKTSDVNPTTNPTKEKDEFSDTEELSDLEIACWHFNHLFQDGDDDLPE